MQQSRKKSNERMSLMVMKRLLPDFPSGEILEAEAPDFLVQSDRMRVGIEVTRFYLDGKTKPPLQQSENLQAKVVEQAEALHCDRGGRPFHVAVSFDDNCPVGKPRVPVLARELASIVAREAPGDTELWRVKVQPRRFNERHLPERLPPEIDSVDIWYSPQVTKACWSVPRAGVVAELDPDPLQAALDRKRNSYPDYRSRCDAAWLLVVAEGTAPSSFAELIPGDRNHMYSSPFDRAFFLSAFGGGLTELRLSG